MKAIKMNSAFALIVFLLLCLPASGFKLKNPLEKLGIPDPILDQLGSLMYTTKLKTCDLCGRKPEVKQVETVWANLLKAAQSSEPYKAAKVKSWQWEVALVEAMDIADAEAFPGGKVIIYSGVSGLAKNDPDQLAFILGHEMAHALARHAKARIDKHTKTAIMSAVTGGSLNASELDPKVTIAAMAAMGVAYEGAAVKPFAKAQESEADQNALVIMAKAGYDPKAAETYFNRLKEVRGKVKRSMLEDHPPMDERLASLKKYMPEAIKIYRKAKG